MVTGERGGDVEKLTTPGGEDDSEEEGGEDMGPQCVDRSGTSGSHDVDSVDEWQSRFFWEDLMEEA